MNIKDVTVKYFTLKQTFELEMSLHYFAPSERSNYSLRYVFIIGSIRHELNRIRKKILYFNWFMKKI